MQNIVMLVAGNERGGAASHLVTFAEALQDNAVEPKFLFVSIGRGPLHKSLVATGVNVRLLDGSMRSSLAKLVRILRELPDAILHSHGPRMNILAAWVARQAKRPWTATIHSNPNLDFLSSKVKTMFYPPLHKMHLASAIGLFVGNPEFADLLPVKTVVFVPNALAIPHLPHPKSYYEQALRQKLGVPDDGTVIGIAARLDPVKDIPTLMKALAHLEDESVHLAIAGDGAEMENLKTLRDSLNLRDRVHFLGFIDHVVEFYAGLTLHVLTSISEGASPFCLLEAGAVGVPNIGTKIPGIMNLLDDEITGHCVDVGDDQALARVIADLLTHPLRAKETADAFLEKVLPKYQPRKMLEAYLRGYKMFIAEH